MLKLLLLVILVAVAVYLTVRVVQRRGVLPPERPERRPISPDDDPDFLRDLDRRRRHPEDPET